MHDGVTLRRDEGALQMWPLLLVREAHESDAGILGKKTRGLRSTVRTRHHASDCLNHGGIVFFRCRVLKKQEEYTEVNNELFLCLEATTET